MKKWIGLALVALVAVMLAGSVASGATNRYYRAWVKYWFKLPDDVQLRMGGNEADEDEDLSIQWDALDDRLEIRDGDDNELISISDEGTTVGVAIEGDLSISGQYTAGTGAIDITTAYGYLDGAALLDASVNTEALSAALHAQLVTHTSPEAAYGPTTPGTAGQVWGANPPGRGQWVEQPAGTFVGLTDTPESYDSLADKVLCINSEATGVVARNFTAIGDGMGPINSEALFEAYLGGTNFLIEDELNSLAELRAVTGSTILEDADANTEAKLEALALDVADIVTDQDVRYALMILTEGTAGQAWMSDGDGPGYWGTPSVALSDLSDGPGTLAGCAGMFPMINSTEDGWELTPNPVTGDAMGPINTLAELNSVIVDAIVLCRADIDSLSELESIIGATLVETSTLASESALEAALGVAILTANDAAYGLLPADIGTAGQVLTSYGTGSTYWADVAGDVSGPASSTDNAVPRWNGTDGDTLQNSGVLIDDSDNITIPGDANIGGGDITSTGDLVITPNGGSGDVDVYGDFYAHKSGITSIGTDDTGAGVATQQIGAFTFSGKDVTSNTRTWAALKTYTDDLGFSTAAGRFEIDVIQAGSLDTLFSLDGDGLTLAGPLAVEGGEVDIGDAGGFSGLRWNPDDTEVQIYVDGYERAAFGTTGLLKQAPLTFSAPSGTPATTGGCGEAVHAESANGLNYWYLPFGDSSDQTCWYTNLAIPADWAYGQTTIHFAVQWIGPGGTSTSDTVKWEIGAVAIADNGSINPTLLAGSTVTDQWHSATERQCTSNISVTIQGSVVAGNFLAVWLKRDTSVTNNISGDVRYLGMKGYYWAACK